MARLMNPVRTLTAFIDKVGSQKAAAKSLGISTAYLSDIVNERRDLSPRLLAKLGMKRAVIAADTEAES